MGNASRSEQIFPGSCPACDREFSPEFLEQAGDALCPQCKTTLWFVRRRIGPAVVLRFLPGLTSGGEAMRRTHEAVRATQNSPRVVVDLSEMRFVTSIFVSMLLLLAAEIRATGGKMKICGLREAALDAFKITKADQVLDLCRDETTALESF